MTGKILRTYFLELFSEVGAHLLAIYLTSKKILFIILNHLLYMVMVIENL